MFIKLLNWKIVLVIIIALAAFLRFYQLGDIPAGLTNDEVDIGYDAYSIFHTGRDQWGEFLPLISFKGFGDYRPPLYTYLVTPLIPIVGLNSLAVRLPAALFSLTSILILFFILRHAFSIRAGLVGVSLFAVSPWAIGLGRMGIESNVGVTLVLAGILFFLYGLKKNIYLYVSMFLFATTLYTYSGYTLFTPFVIITLILFNYKFIKKHVKETVIGLAIFTIICLPLFIQRDASSKVRFSQINFLQNVNSTGLINDLNDQRGECIKEFPPPLCKLVSNKATTFGSTFVTNYLSHFSVSFLFSHGTETQYSILPKRGLLYIFEFILLMAGIGWIIKNNKKEGYFFLVLFILSPLPDTITGPGHYSRAYVMLPFILIIESLGFIQILSFFGKQELLKRSFIMLSLCIVTISTTMFFFNYTTYFKTFHSRFSGYGYEELMKYIHSVKGTYTKIYISRHLNDTMQYAYYLFYNKYDPIKYQQKTDVTFSEVNNGWVVVNRIENIYFVDALPGIKKNSQLAKENVLFISAPVDFPKKVKKEKDIKDLKNDILFRMVQIENLNPKQPIKEINNPKFAR